MGQVGLLPAAPDRLDRSRTRLNVVPWPNEVTNPARGSGFVRPLAKTARQMGVEILLQHQMTKIHRESQLAGRVIGITAMESITGTSRNSAP